MAALRTLGAILKAPISALRKEGLFEDVASAEAKTFARMCEQSYVQKLERKGTVDGYKLDWEMNEKSQCVYTKGGTLVVVFKGTDSQQDLLVHDLAIIIAESPLTKMDEVRDFFFSALEKHRPRRLRLVGHSLGGNIALTLAAESGVPMASRQRLWWEPKECCPDPNRYKDINEFTRDFECHVFNPGGCYISNKYTIWLCEDEAFAAKHLVSYHIFGDVISCGLHDSVASREKPSHFVLGRQKPHAPPPRSKIYTKKSGLSSHSLANFL